MANIHMSLLKWSKVKIDADKDMNGKSLTNLNEVIANKLNGFNAKYDSDLDGVFEVSAIPNLTRSKITDFWSTPFWNNIPDKPTISEIFYSTTDNLSDVTVHRLNKVELDSGAIATLFNISGEVKLLTGFVTGAQNFNVRYTIDGASTVTQDHAESYDQAEDTLNIAVLVPIHATSSLKVDIENTSGYTKVFGGMAVTKCPFLDEKKPNILLDVDEEGRIIATHESQRLIDKSGYISPKGCKHVHLVGDYELKQLPRNVPLDYVRFENGKFERAKWGYIFRKEVSILGQKQILWEKTFEFDRELTDDEIKQIEEELGVKLVGVI